MGIYVSNLADHRFDGASSAAAFQGEARPPGAAVSSEKLRRGKNSNWLSSPLTSCGNVENEVQSTVCLHTLRANPGAGNHKNGGRQVADTTDAVARALSSVGHENAEGSTEDQVNSLCIGSIALRRLLGRHSKEAEHVRESWSAEDADGDEGGQFLNGAFASGDGESNGSSSSSNSSRIKDDGAAFEGFGPAAFKGSSGLPFALGHGSR